MSVPYSKQQPAPDWTANGTPGAAADGRRSRPVAEFIALRREPIKPYVSTYNNRTVMLARGTTLLIAGPSGAAKSLAGYDLAGLLAADHPGDWLSLRVCGGLRVMLIPYPGEGSDEEIADRLSRLAPDSPGLHVWDRWRLGPEPRCDDAGIIALAAEIRRLELDVVVLDTGSAFFEVGHDISKGLPEAANHDLERIRALADRPLTFVLVVHTKKNQDRDAPGVVQELDQIAGTFARKADGAIVIRKIDERRRRVVFAKSRTGPEPTHKIATLPAEGSDEPPRLTIVADVGGAPVKPGTDAEAMADWIRTHDVPVRAVHLRAHFDEMTETTLKRRAIQLEELGIKRQKIRGGGGAVAYGTSDQWARELGIRLTEAS